MGRQVKEKMRMPKRMRYLPEGMGIRGMAPGKIRPVLMGQKTGIPVEVIGKELIHEK